MKPTKKLSLKKETLRDLAAVELKKVGGGMAVTDGCGTDTCNCGTGAASACVCTYSVGVRCPTYFCQSL